MSFDDENYDILTDLFLANDSKCATHETNWEGELVFLEQDQSHLTEERES
jgi:hypothetical protein